MNPFPPNVFRTVSFTVSRAPIALLLTLGLAVSGCQDNTENPLQQTSNTISPQVSTLEVSNTVSSQASNLEVAVVRGLTMGDRACYMTLEDAQGQSLEEEASFELCEQAQLVGQRVRLTRVPTPILAMSCQGDPACTQSDTVNLIIAAELVSSDSSSSMSAAVVSQLYERFPAPSADAPLSAEDAILDQEREVLTQFFDDELTDLILSDRDCAMQRGEVCRLDFDPIWNSQDPTAYEFEVLPTEQPEIVEVRVQVPDSLDEIKLEYRLVQEDGEWRISDISYPEGFTLHELLDTFPPE